MLRIHGELTPLSGFRMLIPKDLQQMIYSMLTQKQRETFEEHLELDLSYSLPGRGRFRVNVFQQRDAIGSVMRVIPFEVPDNVTVMAHQQDPREVFRPLIRSRNWTSFSLDSPSLGQSLKP